MVKIEPAKDKYPPEIARITSKLSRPHIVISPQRPLHTFTSQLIEYTQKMTIAQWITRLAPREV